MSGLTDDGGTLRCASDLQLDRHLSGELAAEADLALREHAAHCGICSERIAWLSASRDAFLADTPSMSALAGKVAAGRRRGSTVRRGVAAMTTLAAAAAALIALRGAPSPGVSETRLKGGPSVGYFVKRGERVTEGSPDTLLHPGDRVRFVYSSRRQGYLALFNRDGRGVSRYFPAEARAAAVRAGSQVPLDFSVELDDYLGEERVFALFCDGPIELDPVALALQRGDATPPDGCTVTTLELHKGPAP